MGFFYAAFLNINLSVITYFNKCFLAKKFGKNNNNVKHILLTLLSKKYIYIH